MTAVKRIKGMLLGLVLPIVVYAFFSVLSPSIFLNSAPGTVYTILVQSITTAILAWGMYFSMTVGALDFSIAAEMIMYEVMATIFYTFGGFWPMVILTAVSAMIIGTAKAIVKELIGIKTMVVGLALTYILASVAEVLSVGRSTTIGKEAAFLSGMPYNFIILTISGLVMWFLISKSKFGAHIKAVGSNVSLAKAAGIKDHVVGFQASLVGSVFAGIAAIFTLSRGVGVTPQTGLGSISTVFSSLMCVFIAMFIAKYANMAIGIFVGAVSISIISMGLVSIGFDSELNSTVTSGFLLILMSYTVITESHQANKIRREVAAARIKKDEQTAEEDLGERK